MARIVLQDVTKRFGKDSLAVDRVSMEIADGEFMVLVGPSGCGKTTLLRIIAGLEELTDGEVVIGDRVVTDLAPKHRDVAMVFQNYALYPHMTVAQNIAIGLKLRKRPKAEIAEKVAEAARVLGLEPLLHRKPAELSGGQRQRVAMGRAMVRAPQAFLMDEPLSNLDAKLRVQMRAELARLRDQLGTTTVYVTHDQVEAMTLGDRVAVMRLGRIQQVASPQELYDHPANLFVAGFIGSPAMNFMGGTLEDGKLRTALGDMPLSARHRQAIEAAGASRDVIVGIRPEHFEDVSLVSPDLKPNGLEFNATIDVIESLGSDKFVFFTQELGKAANVAELQELARDSGRADTGSTGETVVARLDPASRVTEGESARLWVDARKLHIFDPSSGLNLSLGTAAAPAGAAGSAAPASPASPAGAAGTAGTAEADARAGQAPTTIDPASGADPR
jgi:multiple sugar transport system ATP-binding protein